MSSFLQFNLDEKLLKVLNEIKYEKPTSIQELAIPKVLDGLDLIASAQTGTGKTGAFMLPILHLFANGSLNRNHRPKVLVLVPTRELALQVSEETKKYSRYLPHIKTVCIYGGVPYPIQKRALSSQYDILIATPGRLIDHLQQSRIDLSEIKLLVLDEADRMLDMGFIDPVEQIVAATPHQRQTLLFSATIDQKILPFSRKLQKNPFEIRVKTDFSLKENIDTSLYYVDDLSHKMRILDHLLENTEMTQMIIFASTISQTKILAQYLQDKDYRAGSLHGDMDQKQRTKSINKLRKGIIDFLVATDVAARGIDIASLSHVLNFDLPFQPEDFIHRIGRTGRAGAKGVAITFATYREDAMVAHINRLLGKPLPLKTIEGMEPREKEKTPSRPNHRSRQRRVRGKQATPHSSGFADPKVKKKPKVFTKNKNFKSHDNQHHKRAVKEKR